MKYLVCTIVGLVSVSAFADCPKDMHPDPMTGLCVYQNFPPPSDPFAKAKCPTGSEYNSASGTCVPKVVNQPAQLLVRTAAYCGKMGKVPNDGPSGGTLCVTPSAANCTYGVTADGKGCREAEIVAQEARALGDRDQTELVCAYGRNPDGTCKLAPDRVKNSVGEWPKGATPEEPAVVELEGENGFRFTVNRSYVANTRALKPGQSVELSATYFSEMAASADRLDREPRRAVPGQKGVKYKVITIIRPKDVSGGN